jgi:DNA-binding XRE family transcriptional regulator
MYILDGARAQQLRRELEAKWQRDVTQTELAEIIEERLKRRGVSIRGLNRNSIGKIENGRFREVDLEVINEIAALYAENGLDASNILRYDTTRDLEGAEKNVAPRYAAA